MSRTLINLCFASLFSVVLLAKLSTAQTVDLEYCANMVQNHTQGSSNFTAAMIQQLIHCWHMQQSALEETSLNLTSMIANLKSSKEKRYLFHKVQLNWSMAAESCAAEGQELAIIKNKQDHDKYLADMPMPKGSQNETFWVGGFDPTNRGQFVWHGATGADPEQLTYQSWATGQPRRTCASEYEECLSSKGGDWTVTSCAVEHFYTCQFYYVPLANI